MTQQAANPAVEKLEPQTVWSYFAQIAAVPRPSEKEEKARAFMHAWAKEHGFNIREDRVGNVVIDVPASAGCEKAPIVVLQGHLDMVCEKNSDTQFDFDSQGIRLIVEQDEKGQTIVRADGTTLGADNGIGLALAMAAATDPNIKHPPLELLATINEEMGMTGAKALEPDFVRGRRMINLDSEEDSAIYIGCAGGMDTTLTWTLNTAPAPTNAEGIKLTVSGLRGGHSGGDIHKNYSNAIKLLVQVLRGAENTQIQLAELTGGSKRNAIPREAHATIVGDAGTREALSAAADIVQAEAIKHFNEKGGQIRVEPADASAAASINDTHRLLTGLAALPHGVLAVVPAMPDLVQTSNSMSTAQTQTDGNAIKVVIGCLSRSSLRPELHAAVRQITAVGALAQADVKSDNEYPGWAPNVDSPTLAICRRVYQEQFGSEPDVTAIHAGLECGLIGERMGEGTMDMVSFGPRIEGAHSPDERVWVNSVAKIWKYLQAVLAELSKA